MIPDFEAFARAYQAGAASVAVTTLIADLETPVSAYLKLARGRGGNMFLLESVEGGAQRGRYSMIGLDPDVDLPRRPAIRPRSTAAPCTHPDAFAALPAIRWRRCGRFSPSRASSCLPGLPPMSAGVFGYLGYDMVRRMEAARGGQARSDRRAGRAADPPDGHGRFRLRRATRCRS